MSSWHSPKARAPALASVLPSWLLARALVLIAVVAAEFIYFGGDSGGAEMFLGHERGLMAWDADWYLRIAEGGYDYLPEEGLRYFPLYPIGARLLAALGPSEKIALLLIANAFALAAGVLLYRLVMLEKGDPVLARRAAWLLALAPPAFVLVMAYTESLAITFAVGVFYAIRRDRWAAAAALGLLAGLVRPTGLLLLVPLAIEALRGRHGLTAGQIGARILAFLSPIAGTSIYLWWSHVATGDAWLPLTVQQRSNARGEFQLPFVTFWEAVRELVSDARIDQGLHLLWVAAFVWLIVHTFRRWPISYGAFATISLVQAVATTNLNSLERYGYGAWPLILAAASLPNTERGGRMLLAGCAVAMTAYATAAFVSGFVP